MEDDRGRYAKEENIGGWDREGGRGGERKRLERRGGKGKAEEI